MAHPVNAVLFRLGYHAMWISSWVQKKKVYLTYLQIDIILLQFIKLFFLQYTLPEFSFTVQRKNVKSKNDKLSGLETIIPNQFLNLNLIFSHLGISRSNKLILDLHLFDGSLEQWRKKIMKFLSDKPAMIGYPVSTTRNKPYLFSFFKSLKKSRQKKYKRRLRRARILIKKFVIKLGKKARLKRKDFLFNKYTIKFVKFTKKIEQSKEIVDFSLNFTNYLNNYFKTSVKENKKKLLSLKIKTQQKVKNIKIKNIIEETLLKTLKKQSLFTFINQTKIKKIEYENALKKKISMLKIFHIKKLKFKIKKLKLRFRYLKKSFFKFKRKPWKRYQKNIFSKKISFFRKNKYFRKNRFRLLKSHKKLVASDKKGAKNKGFFPASFLTFIP